MAEVDIESQRRVRQRIGYGSQALIQGVPLVAGLTPYLTNFFGDIGSHWVFGSRHSTEHKRRAIKYAYKHLYSRRQLRALGRQRRRRRL